MRKKVDLEAVLGVALARINNVDIEDKSERVEMGVGTDEQNIRDWVDDIWGSYDSNANGLIDRLEIKAFVSETLKTAGIKI